MIATSTIERRLLAAERAVDSLISSKPIDPPPDDWHGWLTTVFPSYFRGVFATYQADFWRWVWSINDGASHHPFVAIWPRGYGKSTSVEIAIAALAARGKRVYVLYASETQQQADTHVQNVANLLESATFARHYPEAAQRRVGKYGNSQGWRRNRLRTASGFTLDALGLDTAARGAKVDDDRPDLLVFDDIDGRHDTPPAVTKKITTLTESILSARAAHAAVVFAQNLVHRHGIVARLADGRADFLADRAVSGPHPALIDAEYVHDGEKWRITGGVPTWASMPIPVLQSILDTIGKRAFERELQHNVKDAEGALWTQATIDRFRDTRRTRDEVRLTRVVVGVDPPGSSRGAECGIVVAGKGLNQCGYILADFSLQGTPSEWGTAVVAASDKWLADAVAVERNFGGDMVAHTLRTIRPNLTIIEVTASRGKDVRAEPISSLYARGEVSHLGYLPALEEEMTTWVPGGQSPNRMDALVWALTELQFGQNTDATSYSYLGEDDADPDDFGPIEWVKRFGRSTG